MPAAHPGVRRALGAYSTGRTAARSGHGWRDRMALLNLRELLSVVARFGPHGDCVERIRGIVKRFG